jgi:membrane protein
MYLVIPNTKVKFKDAAIAGVLAGSAFQLFQVLYINGQVLLSRYDVVYGSFAAIPLLLLWLQISCLIVLLGAEISYASQNIQNFEYEADSKNISIRYKNFLTMFITWLVVKQYESQNPPLSPNQIAQEHKIPIRLVNQLLSGLVDAGVMVEVFNETNRIKTYQPAIDINQLSITVLFEKVESFGAEHFLENKNQLLDEFWSKTHANSNIMDFNNRNLLVKDI